MCVNPSSFLSSENLNHYDAFQLVKIEYINKSLEHISWDGSERIITELNWSKPNLWTSNTLYSETEEMEKMNRFRQLVKNNSLSTDLIIEFHKSEKIEKEKGIKNPYDSPVATTSLTSVLLDKSGAKITYIDLLDKSLHCLSI